MLNYIWLSMIVGSVVCSIFTGRTGELTLAITDGADKAVSLLLSMAGIMCLWTGIMKIADKSGISAGIAKILSPVLRFLMPDYAGNKDALSAISANVTANMLGLGNAATPLGVKAMKEMQKTNRLGSTPNNSMIMFVVINTASVQIIPATTAALRKAAGSSDPYCILPLVWISSVIALIAGIVTAKILSVTSQRDTETLTSFAQIITNNE